MVGRRAGRGGVEEKVLRKAEDARYLASLPYLASERD
jgi:hypothetical protein